VNIWEILGIGVTGDFAVIKSAYARQLKGCHPEDDPDGFQHLREAFEIASKYAKSRVKKTGGSLKQGKPGDSPKGTDFEDNHADAHLDTAFQTGTAEFFRLMQVLYDDFYARIKIENWSKILQADLLWNIKAKEVLRPTVLRFFAEHPVLPQSVWHLMDKEFEWSDSTLPLPGDCDPDLLILQRETDPQWDLRFSLFHKDGNSMKEPGSIVPTASEPDTDIKDWGRQQESLPIWNRGRLTDCKDDLIDFSLFVQCRRNLRDAIIEDSDVEAEGFYIQAVTVFADDPDIYRIYFDYLNSEMPNGRTRPGKDMHLKIINKLIEFYPDNHIYLIKRADLCLERAFYEMAIGEYLRLLVMFPDNLEIPFHLAAAYSGIGRMREKRRYFRRIYKTFSKTQERLRLNKGRSTDSIAVTKQMEANERMFAELQRIPADSFTTNLITTLAVLGAFVIIALIVIIAQKTGLYGHTAKNTVPDSSYSQNAAAE